MRFYVRSQNLITFEIIFFQLRNYIFQVFLGGLEIKNLYYHF
jgi:hypothetical protein